MGAIVLHVDLTTTTTTVIVLISKLN